MTRTARPAGPVGRDDAIENRTQAGRPGRDRFGGGGEARQALVTRLAAGRDLLADQWPGRQDLGRDNHLVAIG